MDRARFDCLCGRVLWFWWIGMAMDKASWWRDTWWIWICVHHDVQVKWVWVRDSRIYTLSILIWNTHVLVFEWYLRPKKCVGILDQEVINGGTSGYDRANGPMAANAITETHAHTHTNRLEYNNGRECNGIQYDTINLQQLLYMSRCIPIYGHNGEVLRLLR